MLFQVFVLPEALKHANGASGPLSENGPVRTTSYQSLPRCELAVSDSSMWDEMWVLSPTYFLGEALPGISKTPTREHWNRIEPPGLRCFDAWPGSICDGGAF